MTEEEIKVCKKYNIDPMYTDIEPYIILYQLEQDMKQFKLSVEDNPEKS